MSLATAPRLFGGSSLRSTLRPWSIPTTSFLRRLFIQVQGTPNPKSLKFVPGKTILEGSTADFASVKDARRSPLARKLFQVPGVTNVMLGPDFVAVSVEDEAQWPVLKPDVFAAIMDFDASGEPVIVEDQQHDPNAIQEEDDEVVAYIKELLETRVRPAVQDDGGDIVYRGFKDGIVYLQMQGSCVGCPSSTTTLKGGIENMLMHYVEEVEGVEEWIDEDLNRASQEAFEDLEKKLAQK